MNTNTLNNINTVYAPKGQIKKKKKLLLFFCELREVH